MIGAVLAASVGVVVVLVVVVVVVVVVMIVMAMVVRVVRVVWCASGGEDSGDIPVLSDDRMWSSCPLNV